MEEKTLYNCINYIGGGSRFGPVDTMIMLVAQVSKATTLIITNEIILENDKWCEETYTIIAIRLGDSCEHSVANTNNYD